LVTVAALSGTEDETMTEANVNWIYHQHRRFYFAEDMQDTPDPLYCPVSRRPLDVPDADAIAQAAERFPKAFEVKGEEYRINRKESGVEDSWTTRVVKVGAADYTHEVDRRWKTVVFRLDIRCPTSRRWKLSTTRYAPEKLAQWLPEVDETSWWTPENLKAAQEAKTTWAGRY